ncbi:hypothetical protein AWC38_SpisGene23727 [Stylophora pistillata]|uniref:SWIM-type domain-containing protein n=1 Tax=Stylophora pistillata TaxID=50429 RepID=A0A2B4R599_STYPI|nr:hypothetical protein AWC38_SpisGene23727 [Stylophora pistillata]
MKGDATPSTKIRDQTHKCWILFDNNSILSTWCTCVAGTSLNCNHILAVLYKINFAYKKGYSNPACTTLPEGWNRGTHKQVEPRRICDLFIRNDSKQKEDKKTRTPINSQAKREFDPRHPEQRQITNDQVSFLYQKIKANNPNVCVLYSLDASVTEELPPSLRDAAGEFLSLKNNTENFTDEPAKEFIEYIQLTIAQKNKIEDTRGQGYADNTNADFFSRFPVQTRDQEDPDPDEHYVFATAISSLPVTAVEIADLTKKDKELGKVYEYTSSVSQIIVLIPR